MEGSLFQRWEDSLQKDFAESFSRQETVIELCCCSWNCRTATLWWEHWLLTNLIESALTDGCAGRECNISTAPYPIPRRVARTSMGPSNPLTSLSLDGVNSWILSSVLALLRRLVLRSPL